MGHGGLSKRHLTLSPTNEDEDDFENSLPQFPRPQSINHGPSMFSTARLSDHDRRRHAMLGRLFSLHSAHRPPVPVAVNADNPQFPLVSAGDDGGVGGRTLLHEFLTFLDLKGAD